MIEANQAKTSNLDWLSSVERAAADFQARLLCPFAHFWINQAWAATFPAMHGAMQRKKEEQKKQASEALFRKLMGGVPGGLFSSFYKVYGDTRFRGTENAAWCEVRWK